MKNLLNKLANLPWIKFIRRYWVLLAATALFLILALSNTLFSILGTFVYIPALTLAGMVSALFLRNVFNSKTTDDFSDRGLYDLEWEKLDGKTKVIISVVQIGFYFIGACIVASGLLK